MISEEDFQAASDADAELAFVRLERKFREAYERNLEGGGNWAYYTIQYMNHVVAAARYLEIDLFHFWTLPKDKSSQVSDSYDDFRHELDQFTIRVQLAYVRSGPKNSVALDESEKTHIRAYVGHIKDIIGHSKLLVAKKERLYDKINAFIAEVDRDRTPLQRFTDVIMALSTTGGDAAKELEPTWKWVRLAAEVLGARQETEHAKLPPPTKKIEGPKKQLAPPKKNNGFGLDDEIPF